MTDISIIIVNYNVKELADNCISSVYKSRENFKIEIFFVDNNSIDGSSDFIRSKYSDVTVISNKKNLGFSKANNIALKKAKGRYILILNPDTVLEEGTFSKLIKFCESDNKIGAVSSKLILSNGKLDLACRRSFPRPSVAIPRLVGLSKIFPKSRIFAKYNLTFLDENKIAEVDSICGAFMFIPSKVFNEIGFFDEDYFMYGEDIDLCYRIKNAGYKIFYFPEVTTIHLKGESTKKANVSFVSNFYGAMSIFVRKNFTGASRFLLFVLQTGIFYRSMVSYLKRFLRIVYPLVIDVLLIYASFIISISLRFDILPNRQYMFIISVYAVIWIILLSLMGIYMVRNHFSVRKTFNALLVGFFVNSSITYFFKEYAYSREVVITSTVFSLVLLIGWRSVVNSYYFIKRKNITLSKTNLLVVTNIRLSHNITERFTMRYNIIYFNDLSNDKSMEDLKEIIRIRNIKDVIFSDDYFPYKEILKLMWSFRNSNVNFNIVPSEAELMLSRLNKGIRDFSFIEIEYNINNKLNIFLKRSFDLIFAFILIFTVYPAVLVYLVIKGGDKGKWTSKLVLIPQVLTGKFSFVGIPMWYDNKENEYLGKKGLTGLVQLYNFEGMTNEEVINYNLFYAKNQNLLLDIEIILKTFFKFFRD